MSEAKPSKEWLKQMADKEDQCASIAAGASEELLNIAEDVADAINDDCIEVGPYSTGYGYARNEATELIRIAIAARVAELPDRIGAMKGPPSDLGRHSEQWNNGYSCGYGQARSDAFTIAAEAGGG